MREDKVREILEESIEQFESSKGSIASGIKKLRRATELLEDRQIIAWCELQLGTPKYVKNFKNFIDLYIELENDNLSSEEKNILKKKINEARKKIIELGYNLKNIEELNAEIYHKINKISGGWNNIEFIEKKYNDLVRTKKLYDGAYSKNHLNEHLNLIKANGHKRASFLLKKIEFKSLPKSNFDFLKEAIDDKLLDLNPEIAEQLMIAFQSVSSDTKEEWSQALTTCRRMIEKVADSLFPAQEEKYNGRKVGQTQYINRIWAFMDTSIQSKSNKELAKNHMLLLGNYLDNINKLTNKGVHGNLTKIEAIKTIFHCYLMLADLLEYLNKDYSQKKGKLDINKASMDAIEAVGNVNRNIAKAIVKRRVLEGRITEKKILEIPNIGEKTLDKLKEHFSIPK